MKRKAYAAVAVKHVEVKKLHEEHAGQALVVGFDVGKYEMQGTCRWSNGVFERPWLVVNPTEIPQVVGVLEQLRAGRQLIVAMESTGTYGDPFRYALQQAGLEVQRVSSKASHDYAEIFDGVPSQHDGKDAAVVAELAALGKGTVWPYAPVAGWEEELSYWVEQLEMHRKVEQMLVGCLEGLLSRHWPEATRVLPLSSATLMRTLAHYSGPAQLAADAGALARLQSWGGKYLKAAQAAALLSSAQSTVGAPPGEWTCRRVRETAEKVCAARAAMRRSRRQLCRLAEGQEVLQAQGAVIGVPTACVLWSCVGDPRHYGSGGAYRKAMGLNLKERSSGIHKGELHLSKRGPSRARQWLYFAALRQVQQGGVSQWYHAKKARDGQKAKRALVGVMRRLALALHAVVIHGEAFVVGRLFPKGARPACRDHKRSSAKCQASGVQGLVGSAVKH